MRVRLSKIKDISFPLGIVASIFLLACGFLLTSGASAQNVAPLGAGMTGYTADVTTQGVNRDHTGGNNLGGANRVNDETIAATVDTWTGAASQEFEWVQVTFPDPVNVSSATLVMNAFGDGGWFGTSGTNTVGLVEPDVQVTFNGGASWTTIASTSDYLTEMAAVTAGSGQTPLSTYTFAEQESVNGLRLIGPAGGAGGGGVGGFIGVREMEIVGELTDYVVDFEVNTTTGLVRITNNSSIESGLDFYKVTSASDSLQYSQWNSLQAQDNPGFPAGDGSGNGWEELGNLDDGIVGEGYLADSAAPSSLEIGESLTLGALFDAQSGTQDLQLVYNYTMNDALTTVNATYVASPKGDMDMDGDVDLDDVNPFVLALTDKAGYEALYGIPPSLAVSDINMDGNFNLADVSPFKALLPGIGQSGAPVPEPTALLLVVFGMIGVAAPRFVGRV